MRPTAVTVFGVLNIIFGVLGLLCTPLMLLPLQSGSALQQGNPVAQAMTQPGLYRTYMMGSLGFGLVAAVALLAAGIGLLLLRPWGRALSIGYGIYAIVSGVIGMAVTWLYLIQPMMQAAGQRQGPEAAAAMGGAVGGLAGGCIGMVYPILLLVFMTRPGIVAAFEPWRNDTAPPPA